MTKRYFALLRQERPETNRPWRIIESYLTSDGIRTRLCNGTYQYESDAQANLDKMEKEADKP